MSSIRRIRPVASMFTVIYNACIQCCLDLGDCNTSLPPNIISTGSAVFARFSVVTNRPTTLCSVCRNRPHAQKCTSVCVVTGPPRGRNHVFKVGGSNFSVWGITALLRKKIKKGIRSLAQTHQTPTKKLHKKSGVHPNFGGPEPLPRTSLLLPTPSG